jgi:hypothetical protein
MRSDAGIEHIQIRERSLKPRVKLLTIKHFPTRMFLSMYSVPFLLALWYFGFFEVSKLYEVYKSKIFLSKISRNDSSVMPALDQFQTDLDRLPTGFIGISMNNSIKKQPSFTRSLTQSREFQQQVLSPN